MVLFLSPLMMPADKSPDIAVWISIMLVVIVGLNALPVRFYGETEFYFAGLKVIMVKFEVTKGKEDRLILSFVDDRPSHPQLHPLLGWRSKP